MFSKKISSLEKFKTYVDAEKAVSRLLNEKSVGEVDEKEDDEESVEEAHVVGAAEVESVEKEVIEKEAVEMGAIEKEAVGVESEVEGYEVEPNEAESYAVELEDEQVHGVESVYLESDNDGSGRVESDYVELDHVESEKVESDGEAEKVEDRVSVGEEDQDYNSADENFEYFPLNDCQNYSTLEDSLKKQSVLSQLVILNISEEHIDTNFFILGDILRKHQ